MIRSVDRVLERLQDATETTSGWRARCLAHDDQNPSLTIAEGNDGRALLKCFAGCEISDIVAALGLEMHELFEGRNGKRVIREAHAPSRDTATVQGCTLEGYAEAKGLPVHFLQRLGLSNVRYARKPALRIPYRLPDGEEVAVRFRTALKKPVDGADGRFRWRKGDKPTLYGLERLQEIRKAGYVVLVEGESDAQTLWLHGVAALGIPGASNWRPQWSEHLQGIDKIYVVVEPDQGGETLLTKLGGV